MSRTADTAGTPATELRATLHVDGGVLLELFADLGVRLHAAESTVEDRERTAAILRTWANAQGVGTGTSGAVPSSTAGSRARRAEPRGVVAVLHRADRGGCRGRWFEGSDAQRFEELFDGRRPTDQDSLRAFASHEAVKLANTFQRLRALAAQRLAGGAYLPVLDSYVEQLRALAPDLGAYRLIEDSLVPILSREEYLRLAEDSRARELYAEIDDVLDVLYGQYMDLERGGIHHLRTLPPRRSRAGQEDGAAHRGRHRR